MNFIRDAKRTKYANVNMGPVKRALFKSKEILSYVNKDDDLETNMNNIDKIISLGDTEITADIISMIFYSERIVGSSYVRSQMIQEFNHISNDWMIILDHMLNASNFTASMGKYLHVRPNIKHYYEHSGSYIPINGSIVIKVLEELITEFKNRIQYFISLSNLIPLLNIHNIGDIELEMPDDLSGLYIDDVDPEVMVPYQYRIVGDNVIFNIEWIDTKEELSQILKILTI